ncbi:MAG: PilC/PilY family type IV pilus protein [Limnobacter sp.]|uniref:pilus assembly protein n=1 Tax=Limnobacter sp. TaxID=2003368 RepID=UPI0032EBA752
MNNSQKKTHRCNAVLTALSLLLAFQNVFAAENFNPAYTGRPTATGPIENGAIDVSSDKEVAYRTMYSRDDWSGDIEARRINKSGKIDESKDVSKWESPAIRLEKMDWNRDRIIITSNGTKGIPFRWNQLSQQQRNSLGNPVTGNQVLQYIRGEQTNEFPKGAKFRARKSLLGDIIHSNLYLWEHSSLPNSPTLLYVGANDGMLHAFNAATGHEVFAYVPSSQIENLNKLTDKEYKHRYFVDGQISIARVVKTQKQDIKTILLGTLGRGGPGLYALDITNPIKPSENNAATMLMWEITPNNEFRNLGEIHGSAQITRLIDDTPVAIFGNGFNPKGSGKSTLYIVNLFSGKKISSIEVGNGTTNKPAGLATPTLYDLDVNGKADVAYAGDANGQLWKFDLVKRKATLLFKTEGNAPITTPPVITPHPNGGLMIVFGTGQLITDDDVKSNTKNAIYGFWDGAPNKNSKILEQKFDGVQTRNSIRYRTISSKKPNWNPDKNGHFGWKVDLPDGERMVGEEPTIYAGRFYFVSTNPTGDFRRNWLTELDMFSGSNQKCPVFDLDGDGKYCNNNGDPDPGDLMPNNKSPVSKELDSGVISQPRLIKVQGNQVGTLYNWNDNRVTVTLPPNEPPPNPPPTGGGPGVSGGHFDYDSFANQGGSYTNTKHVHEYDDKYNVTGVNMLSPSESDFKLSNIVGSSNKKFKILLLNQYLNPAVALSIGGADYENVKTYGGLAGDINSDELTNGKPRVSTASSILSKQPVYDLNSIKTLIFNLPLGAFQTYNWWGKGGDSRAGLIPTQTGCVNGVSSDGESDTEGDKGERFNGAFTIQIIDANTPASALELNYPKDTRYGWRVKDDLITKWVIGEYTAFWHHANGLCYGDRGWKKNPPQDKSFSGGGGNNGSGSGDPTKGLDSPIPVKDKPKDNDKPDNKPDEPNPGNGDDNSNDNVCTKNCGQNSFISPPKIPKESAVNAGKVVNRESWLEIFR